MKIPILMYHQIDEPPPRGTPLRGLIVAPSSFAWQMRFLYLTDYRERSLKDVITKLEPKLFRKVTGLNVKDFELLLSLGVFNSALMNDAVYKFKRYEDASLEYTGINKHAGEEKIGGWDTVINRNEYKENIVIEG